MDRIGKEARDVRKEDQPDKLRMISLTDSAPQQLQKVHYSTRTTQNSQLPLSPVSTMDRIGKEGRDVRKEDQPDKLRMISLTDSVPQQLQKVHYSTRTTQNSQCYCHRQTVPSLPIRHWLHQEEYVPTAFV